MRLMSLIMSWTGSGMGLNPISPTIMSIAAAISKEIWSTVLAVNGV
jgi:hypothetical protein